ncbi:CPBP family intramembrane glutamic endopeptidase [Streptococcus ovis]|uniref:CPBP family intramembrane glutamic endopeptidase n=1 Tax=Streptococcus ovis TaxID=82806 RepID=UPI00036D8E5C|nr:CPBP family intramembrane glutamic endopeptidase [Streptococcus ovis]
MGGITETQNQQIVGDEVAHFSPYLRFFDVALVAPLAEEVVFRGIIPLLVFKKYPRLGYVVGAVAFGMLHSVSSISDAVIYIGAGLVLAIASYRYGKLSDSLIVHIINNAL